MTTEGPTQHGPNDGPEMEPVKPPPSPGSPSNQSKEFYLEHVNFPFKIMEWIKVEDSLPQDGDHVWVCWEGGNSPYTHDSHMMTYHIEMGGFHNEQGSYHPTHWMKIAQPAPL